MKILVLGLGNDLLSDDAIGLLAVRELAKTVGDQADVVESSQCGIALLEHFIGYEKAIILDAVRTGQHPPGTIFEIQASDLDTLVAPSPHYAGLPEMMDIAKTLQLEFPKEVKILAIEVADMSTLGGGLSQQVAAALEEFVARVTILLANWGTCPVGD